MANPIQNPVTKEFFSLFDNARVLATRHHQRAFASDVLRATRIYLDSKKVEYNPDLFEDLIVSLKDKNAHVLNDKFDTVLRDVISMIVRGHS